MVWKFFSSLSNPLQDLTRWTALTNTMVKGFISAFVAVALVFTIAAAAPVAQSGKQRHGRLSFVKLFSNPRWSIHEQMEPPLIPSSYADKLLEPVTPLTRYFCEVRIASLLIDKFLDNDRYLKDGLEPVGATFVARDGNQFLPWCHSIWCVSDGVIDGASRVDTQWLRAADAN